MVTLDAKLLQILVCPEDRGPLHHVPGECLYNPRLRRAYRIDAGIPVLLIDEAVTITDDAEHARLVGSAPTDQR
ncbi:Trm112 family protein [Mycolicibacterium sp. 22603]|uniref:Trm112 family protein n=1 Tax=Mycolicibacterium sp. 22603 TaxID=3453950 RepID=UPI003F87E479